MNTWRRVWGLDGQGKGRLTMNETLKRSIVIGIMFILLCACVAVEVYT